MAIGFKFLVGVEISVHRFNEDSSDSLPRLRNFPPPSTGKKAMDVHKKVENIHNQQQQQPEPQSKPNATYHFDDASQSMYESVGKTL